MCRGTICGKWDEIVRRRRSLGGITCDGYYAMVQKQQFTALNLQVSKSNISSKNVHINLLFYMEDFKIGEKIILRYSYHN